MKIIEKCVKYNLPCILEFNDEFLDPALDPLLLTETIDMSKKKMIRLGEALLEIPVGNSNKVANLFILTKTS